MTATKKDRIIEFADDHPDSTAQKIADEVGSSYSYTWVVLRDHRPNYTQRAVSEETEQQIRELAAQTPLLNVGDIAQQCDVHRHVVRRVMRDMEGDR